MKYRRDFVTNSSAASFLIARKPELSERQIEALADYAMGEFLGFEIISPDDSEEELLEIAHGDRWRKKQVDEARKALKEGKAIYMGGVSFYESEWELTSLFEGAWRALADAADDDHAVTIIDGDFNY